MPLERTAAVVVNDMGDILAYSVADTMEACDSAAERRHGPAAWEALKHKGARVVQCRIVIDDTALSPDRSWAALTTAPSISS